MFIKMYYYNFQCFNKLTLFIFINTYLSFHLINICALYSKEKSLFSPSLQTYKKLLRLLAKGYVLLSRRFNCNFYCVYLRIQLLIVLQSTMRIYK